jgi:CheY-like chemotaxis protein
MKASPSSHAPGLAAGAVIVDDDEDAAESLALLLEVRGMEARVALSGEAAVALVREHAPAVVVCDLEMPGMDGLETASRLRALPAMARLHLIALTGRTHLEGAARRAGFDEYVVKPAGAGGVADLLDRICAHGH